MIFNILDNTTELWMRKYIIGEIFSSGGATLYKNPSDQTVIGSDFLNSKKLIIMHCIHSPNDQLCRNCIYPWTMGIYTHAV